MKRTYSFIAKNKVPERQADAIKHEVKKYIGRERRKTKPEGVDFWDFDCKFGETEESAEVINVQDINPNISKALADGKETFYVEVLAKPGRKVPRPKKKN
jgi:hypothetical protein